jgi:hypothetical protein
MAKNDDEAFVESVQYLSAKTLAELETKVNAALAASDGYGDLGADVQFLNGEYVQPVVIYSED